MSGLVFGFFDALFGVEVEDDEIAAAIEAVILVASGPALVLAALGLAATRARPRAWHFGLARLSLSRTIGWTLLGVCVIAATDLAWFTAFPAEEIDELQEFGLGSGSVRVVTTIVSVVVLGPVAEELFFRAFFYTGLRARFRPLPAAVLSASIHRLIVGWAR